MTYIETIIEFHLDNLTSSQVNEFHNIFGYVIGREQLNAALIWCEEKIQENKILNYEK